MNKVRPAAPGVSPTVLEDKSAAAVAGRFAAQLATLGDCEALLERCVAGQQRAWLDDFAAAGGVAAAAAYLRRRHAVPAVCLAVLAALAHQPRMLGDEAMGAVLWPLRLDGDSAELRQLALDCLAAAVGESRERALAWLRHVQRLTRETSLLGRLAQLLAEEDAGAALAAAGVLLAWLAHGDAPQQQASRRELLLLGAHETCRRRVREELLGPAMRQLLGRLRGGGGGGGEAVAVVCSGRESPLTLGPAETAADLERRLGGRLLFAGCVPQSGVFCRADLVLAALPGCGALRCELWPLPWTLRVEGPAAVEAACRIDSRMTGERALAFVAAFHLDEVGVHQLKASRVCPAFRASL